MADIQDKINEILSNPEALRQVQSLGEQLGLAGNTPEKPKPTENKKTGKGIYSQTEERRKIK